VGLLYQIHIPHPNCHFCYMRARDWFFSPPVPAAPPACLNRRIACSVKSGQAGHYFLLHPGAAELLSLEPACTAEPSALEYIRSDGESQDRCLVFAY